MKKSELENNEDYVECKDCGHIVAKGRAQVVIAKNYVFTDTDKRYYCELHKKSYDRVDMFGLFHEIFFREMEVSEDGTPIGYKKSTPKK